MRGLTTKLPPKRTVPLPRLVDGEKRERAPKQGKAQERIPKLNPKPPPPRPPNTNKPTKQTKKPT